MSLKFEVKNVILSNLKKPSDIKIGIEIENIIYNDKNKRIKVNHSNSLSARDLLRNLKNTGNYSLEPGGQIEWASEPYTNLHDLEKSIRLSLEILKNILNEQNLKIMPFGLDPHHSPDQIELIDQSKYKIMDKSMTRSGSMGQWMMRCTSSIQVNFDASTEEEMEETAFIADCLHPIAAYLFSNSPFKNDKPALDKNLRSIIWSNTDNARCNNLFDHGIISKTGLLDKYIEFFLNTPSIFSFNKEGKTIRSKQSFGQLIKEQKIKGEAKNNLILSYLRQIFTNVRIKNLVEIRGADRTPEGYEIAPAAFWTGLLMEPSVRADISDTISSWGTKDRILLYEAGLSLNINQMGPCNKTFGWWINHFGRLALKGLKKRNLGEENLFRDFFESVMNDGSFSLSGQNHE